jgi:hypothetical protein
VYIFLYLLPRLGLGFFVSVTAMRRLGLPGGLGLVLPVLLCLKSISAVGVGGDAVGGNGFVRIVYLCYFSSGHGWMFEEGALRSASGEIFFNISGDLVSTGGGHIRFVYQPSSKPGWVFNPTSSGGSCPLLVLRCGRLELPTFLGRQVLHGPTM